MFARGRGRLTPRIRTRSMRRLTRSSPDEIQDIDLDRIGVDRMVAYLSEVGALPAPDPTAVPIRSGVPTPPSVALPSQLSLASLEALVQRMVGQAQPVAPPPPTPTVTSASVVTQATSGKPLLKFPDPPVFEGEPVK
jgi:hypothetical protein